MILFFFNVILLVYFNILCFIMLDINLKFIRILILYLYEKKGVFKICLIIINLDFKK